VDARDKRGHDGVAGPAMTVWRGKAFTPMFLVFSTQFPDDDAGNYGAAQAISS